MLEPQPSELPASEIPAPLVVTLVVKNHVSGTGIGRYADELEVRLRAAGFTVRRVRPVIPFWLRPPAWALRRVGLDLEAFLDTYPLFLERKPRGLVHLTSQTMGTLLWRYRFDASVLTVHDIIPYIVRGTPGLRLYHHRIEEMFDWIALAGLRRADALVAVSAWTRDEVVQRLGIPASKIFVTMEGVG